MWVARYMLLSGVRSIFGRYLRNDSHVYGIRSTYVIIFTTRQSIHIIEFEIWKEDTEYVLKRLHWLRDHPPPL